MVTVSLVFLLKQNVSYQNGIAIAIGRIICNLELVVYILYNDHLFRLEAGPLVKEG